jgi:predicted transcriptional regulator of viral defense system
MKLIEIRKIFQENNGIMKTSELYKNGITKYEIKKFTDSEFFERISTGYYKLYEEEISDVKLISILLPEAVLCFDTALYNYGYSDRTPTEWHLAIDKDISKSRVRIDYPYIKAYYVEHNLIYLGVEDIIIEDIRMKIYSRDRLICDCLKYERKMDVEIFNKAIINYIKDPMKNVSKLLEIAKIRGVEKKVYDKIGTWL